MSGGVSNVRFIDSVISDAEGSGTYILRVKSKAGRGGFVRDIHTENVHAAVLATNGRPAFAFSVNAQYCCVSDPHGPVADFSNFTFRNVSAGAAEYAGEFRGGNSTHRLRGISMSDVRIAGTKGGWRCSNVDGAATLVTDTLPAMDAKSGCTATV